MIYVCADDYGVSETACEHIEDCVKNGSLNKVSVLPNGRIPYCKERFSGEKIVQALHIDLVEGKPLSSPEDVSLLVSDNGYFKYSFIGLLLQSFLPRRKELEAQIYREIKAQITYWRTCFNDDTLPAIDSHQHTHMIPLIFRTLMRVIRDEGIHVEYIRIPAEPVFPYLMTPSLYFTYHPVNLVKQWLLKLLGLLNRKEFRKSGMKTAYFMGVLFSGKMNEKRVNKVLPHYFKLANKNNKDIELLFHPGYMEPEERVLAESKKTFKEFYLSEGRKIEFHTVMNLNLKEAKKKADDLL